MAGALAAGLLSGCSALPVTLDLAYLPAEPRPLRAAGVHALSYAVAVVDARERQGSLELCRRGGAFGGAVRAARDLRLTLANAIAEELRSHDLRVVRAADSDVTLQVLLVDWLCGVRELGDRRDVYALVEGEVTVRETATGTTPLEELRFEVVRRKPVGSSVRGSQYREVLEEALGEFSRRVVRHPDVLIAVQTVAARLPEAASE